MKRFDTAVSHQFIVLVAVLVATQQVTAIDTVPQLNISQYIGRWYQVYGNAVGTRLTSERKCTCTTADYESTPDGSISVRNACRRKTPDGDLTTARGSATRPDENEQGKLIVTFGPPGSGGNYWVVQLGPPTFNGTFYQYAVVTGSEQYTLFVLARNVTDFKQNYEEEVLTKLREQGFVEFHNRPIGIYQGCGCRNMYLPVGNKN